MVTPRTRQVRAPVRLMRNSGRVLKGAPQFLGRAEGGATVADGSKKLRFSACQGLWKIACRSASRVADFSASSFVCTAPTGTGTIAFYPTFGSFTVLEPVSH